ncbi:MAG: DUF4258 domain-containing protein [Elusimicrobia bacterium]|nr:DUF4258 domain-containing protein [Elusimicrobiota bacterium]
MQEIEFSRHAADQMTDRGTTTAEVEETMRNGERILAKKGRLAFRKNFPYNSLWKGKEYATKQVMPIAREEKSKMTVITVYVFYFGAAK